ncbi:MAG TPA: hypothetical protein VJB37_02700 [Patescibacteria group bacterium]|nr:hypothetical protein [Patescibacteria group bacterium]
MRENFNAALAREEETENKTAPNQNKRKTELPRVIKSDAVMEEAGIPHADQRKEDLAPNMIGVLPLSVEDTDKYEKRLRRSIVGAESPTTRLADKVKKTKAEIQEAITGEVPEGSLGDPIEAKDERRPGFTVVDAPQNPPIDFLTVGGLQDWLSQQRQAEQDKKRRQQMSEVIRPADTTIMPLQEKDTEAYEEELSYSAAGNKSWLGRLTEKFSQSNQQRQEEKMEKKLETHEGKPVAKEMANTIELSDHVREELEEVMREAAEKKINLGQALIAHYRRFPEQLNIDVIQYLTEGDAVINTSDRNELIDIRLNQILAEDSVASKPTSFFDRFNPRRKKLKTEFWALSDLSKKMAK